MTRKQIIILCLIIAAVQLTYIGFKVINHNGFTFTDYVLYLIPIEIIFYQLNRIRQKR